MTDHSISSNIVDLESLCVNPKMKKRIQKQRKTFLRKVEKTEISPFTNQVDLQWHSSASSFNYNASLRLVSKKCKKKIIGYSMGRGYGTLIFIPSFYLIGNLDKNITYEILQKSHKKTRFDLYWEGLHLGGWQLGQRSIWKFDFQRPWLLFDTNGERIASLRQVNIRISSKMRFSTMNGDVFFNPEDLTLSSIEINENLMNGDLWRQVLLFLLYIRSFKIMTCGGA